MTDLTEIKRKLPEAMILEFLDTNEDCTIDLVMLVELGVYTRKDTAVKALRKGGFENDLDYSVLKRRATTTGISAVEIEDYLLTSDSFKEMCMLAETPTGKLVRKYYIEVERRWRREQKEKGKQVTIQPPEPINADIEQLANELVNIIFELTWKSADCITNINAKTVREQKKLKSEFKKGISREFLFSLATEAIGDVGHNAAHQHKEVIKQVRLRVTPYREYFVSKLQEWQALQASVQPALPPAEEFPVRRTSVERRCAVIEFIFELIDQYGSLDAIPRRGKGKAGIDLEVEWGTNKLSKQFGVSPNTILSIWSEVDEAIKEHGQTGARQHLHL